MKKSLIALAFGTLGLGIAEFVMMGILPDVAKDLGISIPTAGHFISAYALGVCVGAPVLTLARKYPLIRFPITIPKPARIIKGVMLSAEKPDTLVSIGLM